MADVYFRPQRLAGDGVFADFVPNLAGIVQATGEVTGQQASTTGQIETHADVVVTGVVTGQPANTTGVTNTLTPETATGAVTGQEASTTGQILAVAPTPVDVTGTVQGQAAITSGIVVVEAASYATATGDSKASPATTTGQILSIGSATATGAVQAQPATTTGRAGLLQDTAPEMLIKLPDGTWSPVNYHDMDYHTDVESAGATEDDLVGYQTDAFKLDRRTHSLGDFIQGNTYLKGQEVSNGSDQSECLIDGTTSDPYVSPTGQPFSMYPGSALPPDLENSSASTKLFGTRVSSTNSGYLTGFRIPAFVDQHYTVYLVANPTTTPIFTLIEDFTSATTGWVQFDNEPVLVVPGVTFDVVAQVNEPAPVPVEITPVYNYLTPQNIGVPASGAISHGRNNPDVMRVNYIDNDAIDRTTFLQSMNQGDIIEGGGVQWSVITNTDQGTYAQFVIAPAITGNAGTGIFRFETVAPDIIDVQYDLTYWSTSAFPTVLGLFGVDVPYSGIATNDNAYMDLIIQDAFIPDQTEWQLKIIGGGSSGETGATAEQRVWLAANSSPFAYLMASTTDQSWTELGRATVGDMEAYAGQIYIQGTRTDTYDAYYAEVKFFAKRIGTLDITQIIVLESSPSPAVGHQITVDGNDVLFEVRGKVAEDWTWTALKFFREIT